MLNRSLKADEEQTEWVIMITELRATFFLVVSFVFFLIIIGVLGLSTIMSSGRWSETREKSRTGEAA